MHPSSVQGRELVPREGQRPRAAAAAPDGCDGPPGRTRCRWAAAAAVGVAARVGSTAGPGGSAVTDHGLDRRSPRHDKARTAATKAAGAFA